MKTKEFFKMDLSLIVAILSLVLAVYVYAQDEKHYNASLQEQTDRRIQDSVHFNFLKDETQKRLTKYDAIINTPHDDSAYTVLYNKLNDLIPKDSLNVDPLFLQMINNHCVFAQYWSTMDKMIRPSLPNDKMPDQIRELIWENKSLFLQLCAKYNYRKDLVRFENAFMY